MLEIKLLQFKDETNIFEMSICNIILNCLLANIEFIYFYGYCFHSINKMKNKHFKNAILVMYTLLSNCNMFITCYSCLRKQLLQI